MSKLILGTIVCAPEPCKRPTFTILKNDRPWSPPKGCAHGLFELNASWLTVTCGKCSERVEPFAVLMNYAEWYEEILRRSKSIEWQHIGVLRERLRAVKDRVAFSDTDREEIRRACIQTGKDTTVEALSELLRRLNNKISAARSTKRKA